MKRWAWSVTAWGRHRRPRPAVRPPLLVLGHDGLMQGSSMDRRLFNALGNGEMDGTTALAAGAGRGTPSIRPGGRPPISSRPAGRSRRRLGRQHGVDPSVLLALLPPGPQAGGTSSHRPGLERRPLEPPTSTRPFDREATVRWRLTGPRHLRHGRGRTHSSCPRRRPALTSRGPGGRVAGRGWAGSGDRSRRVGDHDLACGFVEAKSSFIKRWAWGATPADGDRRSGDPVAPAVTGASPSRRRRPRAQRHHVPGSGERHGPTRRLPGFSAGTTRVINHPQIGSVRWPARRTTTIWPRQGRPFFT